MAQKASNDGTKSRIHKTRNWVSVVYPESAPEGWMDTLNDTHIPAIVSPLHDKDMNPGMGEKKKPHYHVMLMYEGPKEEHIPHAIFDQIGGVGCIPVNSVRGQARYFTHMDNPEKAQYKIDDVKVFSGANYEDLIALPSDKYKVTREMIDFINQNDIRAYCDIVNYAMDEKPDWYNALADNCTYFIEKYIKSRTWKIERSTPDDAY